MFQKYAGLLFLIFLLGISCRSEPDKVQRVIANSGQNGQELVKVIKHYRDLGDNEKLRAAYFLIENLPFHTHFVGEGVANYKKLFSKLLNVPEARREEFELIWDSLKAEEGKVFPGAIRPADDVATISSKFLIAHIEAAFRAWKYPWARHLTFQEFCDYILPYKVVNEEPAEWNMDIQQKYNWLTGAMRGSSDVYEACLKVNDDLKKTFKIRSFPFQWDVTYKELNEIKSGKCYHATQYTAYTMRALGIPVTMDFTPFWGNRNGGHEWNALIYKNKAIPFVGSESDPGKTKIDLAFQRKRGKVYRHVFSIQESALERNEGEEDVPVFFQNYYLKDVTREYIPVTEMKLALEQNDNLFKYAYLCVFNRQKWLPLAIGTVEDSVAIFKDMGRGIVYMPMYYRDKKFEAAAHPVLLKGDGSYDFIACNKARPTTVRIFKKGPAGPSVQKGKEYELFYWDAKWVSLGKQQAAKEFVSFAKVPSNALYWIKSSDKSSNERIFTIKDEKQVWW